MRRTHVKHAQPFVSAPLRLSETQKEQIAALAAQGYRDRQIAQEMDISEGRVAHYRARAGISMVQNRGSHGDAMFKSLVRPAHVRGVSGDIYDPAWVESCNDAFSTAMRTELELLKREASNAGAGR